MQTSYPENITSINCKNLNETQLTSIVEAFPYFSAAQFWLLSNYNKNQDKKFERQASVTALFFSNTNWLNWQLYEQNKHVENNNNDNKNVEPFPPATGLSAEIINKQPIDSQNKTDELIAFEPLHTVDYFASQGIKINEEALTNDKLGTQLKSFTEWLKSMKKVHAERKTEGDEQTDKIIQNIAESSNTNINVVTEAMAEVLLKQGKMEQAIEMYKKLSLNYPHRSAYFAAKINSLKTL